MEIRIATLGIASALVLAATDAGALLDDASAEELLKKSGCALCHSLDKKGIGPAFKEVARKRKGATLAELEQAVRGGSKGGYGSIAMPPNPQDKISDAVLRELIGWILTK